jgi:hypothetical protein
VLVGFEDNIAITSKSILGCLVAGPLKKFAKSLDESEVSEALRDAGTSADSGSAFGRVTEEGLGLSLTKFSSLLLGRRIGTFTRTGVSTGRLQPAAFLIASSPSFSSTDKLGIG